MKLSTARLLIRQLVHADLVPLNRVVHAEMVPLNLDLHAEMVPLLTKSL